MEICKIYRGKVLLYIYDKFTDTYVGRMQIYEGDDGTTVFYGINTNVGTTFTFDL